MDAVSGSGRTMQKLLETPENLFPFHLVLDHDLRMIAVGTALKRACHQCQIANSGVDRHRGKGVMRNLRLLALLDNPRSAVMVVDDKHCVERIKQDLLDLLALESDEQQLVGRLAPPLLVDFARRSIDPRAFTTWLEVATQLNAAAVGTDALRAGGFRDISSFQR